MMMALMELSSAVLPELLDDVLGSEDHAFQIDDADLVAEAAEAVFLLRADGEVDQREDGDEEEEESSSAEQDPEEHAGTRLIGHKGRAKFSRRGSGCQLSAVSSQLQAKQRGSSHCA